MKIFQHYYLIIDLEATCNNEDSFTDDDMEIIEIGAVMMNARNFSIEGTFQSFVRPQRHPLLTPFCIKLTSITQNQVDHAPTYPEAMAAFGEWLSGYTNWLFCSWGNFDKRQFEQDCRVHSVVYPFGSEHKNLKNSFSKSLGVKKGFGLQRALKRMGLDFEGTPHRALSDAINTARVVRAVLEKSNGDKP
jgi:inhibitor of KinA sporulation pathway (predicted exonuclease)